MITCEIMRFIPDRRYLPISLTADVAKMSQIPDKLVVSSMVPALTTESAVQKVTKIQD
jgi:hypothetical protein